MGSTLRVGEFIGPTDARWEALVEATDHDVYHLPAYAEVSAGACGGEALAWLGEVDGASCLIPLVQTPVPAQAWSGWSDLTSPYGYASPLFRGDPARYGALLRSFSHAAAERKCATAFLRSHPFLTQGPLGAQGWTPRGETVSIDLRKPEEQLWTELRKDHRSGLRRLAAGGFEGRIDEWTDYDTFVDLYLQTMRRLGARTSYLFSKEYFDRLRTRLADRLHLCSVVAPDGRIAATALFFREREILQGHLMGWNEAFRDLAPAKLTVWEIARWGQRAGATALHLGGGRGGNDDALLHYKSGYSKLRLPYHTMEIVTDRGAYEGICAARGVAAEGASFFPAYRAEDAAA